MTLSFDSAHAMDVTLDPEPNRALAAALVGDKMRLAVGERAAMAELLYQAQVAKRTGNLARSAHAHTELTTVLKGQPRWVGVLTVGDNVADYAASHEFGTHDEVEGPARAFTGELDLQGNPIANLDDRVRTGGHHAAHDLNAVLEQLHAF